MALTKQSAVISRAGGTVTVTLGPASIDFDLSRLKAAYSGQDRSREFLLGQIVKTLLDAGVDPATATAVQMKAAIEAGTYYW